VDSVGAAQGVGLAGRIDLPTVIDDFDPAREAVAARRLAALFQTFSR
jgi:hypothetical protein